MAKNDAIWGIDLGNCALKAIKLRKLDDQLLVEALEVIEHKQICSTVEDTTERSNMIREALEQFSMRQSTTGDTVAISLSGQTSFTRFLKLPPVEPKKIPEIVQFEAIQQIPFPINEVVWDFQTLQHEDSPDVEVGIFAVKTEQVNGLVELFANAGIKVDLVQAAPLALYNFVRHDDLIGDQTTVVVDIGTATTDLVVTDQQHVWLRNIPLGGNNFTEALVKAFKLNFSKAEHLKRTAATSKYARQIFQAMRPVFDDLVGELNRSFGHYKSTNREAKLERIIGLGSAFKLPGLQKFLRQNLSLDVERVESFKGASTAGGVSPAMLTEHVPSFSVAYGLALQGLGQGAIQSSLLPLQVVRERNWRQKRSWFAAAAACVVMGVLAMGMRHLKTRDDVNSAMANAEQEINVPINAANRLKSEYNQKKSAGAEELRRIESVTSVTKQRAFLPELYRAICNSFPVPQEDLLAKPTAIPRGERRQIFIEHLQLTYAANVDMLLAAGTTRDRSLKRNQRRSGFGGYGRGFGGGMPGMSGGMGPPGMGGFGRGGMGRGGRGGMGGGARDPGFYMKQAALPTTGGEEETPTKPGFLAELVGTTPNQDTNFVMSTLLDQIRQIQPSENTAKQFYVDKVEMLKLDPLVSEIEEELNPAQGRGNMVGMPGMSGAVQPAPEQIGIRDPLTNERIEGDYRFEARWVIYIGTREENETEDGEKKTSGE